MKHLITTVALTLVALVWLTDPVSHVLNMVWPVVALFALMVAGCAALAASMWMIGRGLRELRPPPARYEIIPREEAMTTYARDVRAESTTTPAGLASTATNSDTEPEDRTEDYNRTALLFVFIGNMHGRFSLSVMADHCTDPAWRFWIGLLTAEPHCILTASQAGTWFTPGWTYGRMKAEIIAGILSLPYPTTPPPAVYWKRARRTHTPHTHTTPNKRNKPGHPVQEYPNGLVIG